MNNWRDIEVWATARLNLARSMIEGDLSEIDTAKLRGRIATLKELLAIPSTQKVLESQAKAGLPE